MTRFDLGNGLVGDLTKLVETRLLIQANSGAGKSWLLRRLLESTHGKIQQIVIDPEGEFSSLREKFDYVLAAKSGGDTSADPRSAKLLAERLLELGVSAILDIYELKAHDRIRFVRLFLEALVNARKELWHPALIVVDEAHIFCPQTGEAESADAVKDLCTRGRKRGFCAVLATQRLSKLHKDAAAELNNKLIGRSGLDVDMKRAADELGFTDRASQQQLRHLDPGQFFVFGPALSSEVRRATIGAVQTKHPTAGARIAFTPPAPTAKIKAMLPKLADLPAEAEGRERSLAALEQDNARLKRELVQAQRAQPAPVAPAPKVERVEVPMLTAEDRGLLEKFTGVLAGLATDTRQFAADTAEAVNQVDGLLQRIRLKLEARVVETAPKWRTNRLPEVRSRNPSAIPDRARGSMPSGSKHSDGVSGVCQRVLDAMAELAVLGVDPAPRIQVAFLAGYSNLNSTGFAKAIGKLRTDGLITYPNSEDMALTASGRAHAEAPARPRTPDELHDRILSLLGGVHARVLRPLIAAYPESLGRMDLAGQAGYSNLNSTGFAKAVGRLRSLGFIDYPDSQSIVALPVLFLEARR